MKERKDGRYQKKVTLSDGRQRLMVGDTTTVDEWAKTWFAIYKSDLRANTQAMYRNAYNVHILPYLATWQLRDVRPVHIQQVMKEVAGLSDSMQHKVLLTMRQLFTTARQNGLILADPTEGVVPFPS